MQREKISVRFAALVLATSSAASLLVSQSATASDGAWNIDASGNYSDAANWLGGIVPGVGPGALPTDIATFGDVISGIRQVTFDVSPTLSVLTIDSGFAYIFAGTNPIQLGSGLGGGTINIVRPAADAPSALVGGSVISAPLSGTNGLTKTGAGTVTLSNTANTYTGPTNILGGTLQINGGSNTLSSGPINISNSNLRVTTTAFTTSSPISISGNANVQGFFATTLNGAISGNGNFIRSLGAEATTVTLNGVNTYTGNTIVRGGTLVVGGVSGAIASSPVIDVGGIFVVSNDLAANNNRLNANVSLLSRGSRLAFGQNATSNVTHTLPTLTLGSGRTELITTGTVGTVNTVAIGTIDRQNRATLFLRGNNTTSTQVTLDNAPTLLGGSGVAGSTNQSIVPWMVGNALSNQFIIDTTFVTYDAGTKLLRPLNVATEFATSFAAAASTDNVRIAPTQVGPTAAPISISVPNGGVTVNSLIFANQATFGNSLTVTGATSDPITITSGVINTTPVNSLNSTTIDAPINFGSAEGITHNTSGVTLSFAKPISGSNGLTISGTGLVAFRAEALSTYTGTTTLIGGTVQTNGNILAGQPGPFGTSSSAIIMGSGSFGSGSGGSARLLVNIPTVIDRPFIIRGDPVLPSVFGTTNTTTPIQLTINAPITLEGDLGVEIANPAHIVNFNGVISGNSRVTSVGSLQGIANLNAANTYTGGTQILNTQFFAGNDQAFGTGPISFVTTAGPNSNSRIGAAGAARTISNAVVLRNNLVTVGSFPLTLTGSVNLGGGNPGTGGAPFQLNVPLASPLTLTGTLFDGGVNKTGTGTLTLTGNNTYVGPTIVTAGTLAVNNVSGSGTGRSAVSVLTGGTLTGSGSISGPVTIANGGALSPGNSLSSISPGTIALGSLVLSPSSISNFELGAAGSSAVDLVNVARNLTLDGTLQIIPLSGFDVGVYTLFSFGTTLVNDVAVLGSLPPEFVGVLDLNTPGQVNLVVSLIPEPAMLAMVTMPMAMLLRRRSKRA